MPDDRDTALIEWWSEETGHQVYEITYGHWLQVDRQSSPGKQWVPITSATEYDETASSVAYLAVSNVTNMSLSYVSHFFDIASVRTFILMSMRGKIITEINT